MDLKLELNTQKIVDKEFHGKKMGYDPLEVDQFLDVVIKWYLISIGLFKWSVSIANE